MTKAKQAPAKEKEENQTNPTPKAEKPPKAQKILKRRVKIPKMRFFDAGEPVTSEMREKWAQYYKSKGFNTPLRSLDWYC